VGDDHHALAGVVALQIAEHAAQAQHHVAPALAAGWAKIELAHQLALLGQFGELGADAGARVAVQHTEFLFAQALVDHHVLVHVAQRDGYRHGRLARPLVGRGHEGGWPVLLRQRAYPGAERLRLLQAQRRQRHVGVTVFQVDQRRAGGFGEIARDVSRALAVTDDPQPLRPAHIALHHRCSHAALPLCNRASFGRGA